MLKIAYIIPSPSAWIMTEIKSLIKKGCNPYVFIYDWTQEKRVEDDTPIVSVSFADHIFANLFFLLKLRVNYIKLANHTKSKMGLRLFFRMIYFAYFLKNNNIKHVHAHFAATATYMAKNISDLIGCSFSFTAHAYDIFKTDVDLLELEEYIGSASFVRTVSLYHKNYLESICVNITPPKIKVITYGVDCSKFKPIDLNIQQENGQITIVAVCNLVPKKGLCYLVDACGKLKLRGKKFICYIVGEGELRNDLEKQIVNLGLTDIVKLTGKISHNEVNDKVNKADIFVLPCVVTEDGDRDGIPNALIEAMATAKPVISTDVAGIPELIEDGKSGFVVPQKETESLCNAIETLAKNSLLRSEFGACGREKVYESFNIDKIADSVIALFKEQV